MINDFNIFAIGGLDEKDKKMLVLETNSNFYIFNIGIKLPSISKLGINCILPDTDWIKNNQKKIKGIFIGNPSYENIGCLRYINNLLNGIPIYTSKLGKTILNNYFNERSMQKISNYTPYKINIVSEKDDLIIDNIKFKFFNTMSPIPDSFSIAVETKKGWIVIIDDFVIGTFNNKKYVNSLFKIRESLGNILLLIVSSGLVWKSKGFSSPNYNINSFLEKKLDSRNRKIITLIDSDYYLFIQCVEVCRNKQIPFIITNGVFYNNYQYLLNNNYLESNKGYLSLPISKINESENAVIFVIDNKQKIYDSLLKLINGTDIDFKSKDTDEVVILNPIIPGFEIHEAQTVDEIAKKDMNWTRLPKTFIEMKASNEDHKQLYSILQPNYVMPFGGLHSDFIRYKYLIGTDNIIITDNGTIIEFEKGKIKESKKSKTLDIQEKYISNNYISDVNESLLRERKQMSENGVVFLNVLTNKEDKNFNSRCLIESFGVFNENDNDDNEIIEKIKNDVNELVLSVISDPKSDQKELKNSIKKIASKAIEKYSNKTPIILTTLINL